MASDIQKLMSEVKELADKVPMEHTHARICIDVFLQIVLEYQRVCAENGKTIKAMWEEITELRKSKDNKIIV